MVEASEIAAEAGSLFVFMLDGCSGGYGGRVFHIWVWAGEVGLIIRGVGGLLLVEGIVFDVGGC
jgi:hypothetical protein